MNSETPPTISMALMNPQMPSVSADSRSSSTQQLSISVWVECVIRKRTGMFSEKGCRYAWWRACQGLNPPCVFSAVPSCTPTILGDQRSWSWRKERWWECTANSKKGGCVGCHSERAGWAFCPATTSHLCWGRMLGLYWWQWELIQMDKVKYSSCISSLSHCRTSARLLETKAANTSSQHNPATGKRPAAAKNPSVFLALDRVNTDAAAYSTGTVPSVPDGAHNPTSSMSAGKPSPYGGSQGWDTVRRIFNPHRGENSTITSVCTLLSRQNTLQQGLIVRFGGFFSHKSNDRFERPVQLAAFCTSSGIWVLPGLAQEKKQRHPVQFQQAAELDDWLNSALCCCGLQRQGVCGLARIGVPARQTARRCTPVHSSQARHQQEHCRQGNFIVPLLFCGDLHHSALCELLFSLSQQSQCDSSRMKTPRLWDLGPPPGQQGLRSPPNPPTDQLHWKSGPLPSPWEEMDRGSFWKKERFLCKGRALKPPPQIWTRTLKSQRCHNYLYQLCQLSSLLAGTSQFSSLNTPSKTIRQTVRWSFITVVLVCFQTRGDLHPFSPDGLRAQPDPGRVCPGPQATTWRTCSDHAGEQRADRLIPRWCVPVPWEAQLTAQSLKYAWDAEQDEHWRPNTITAKWSFYFCPVWESGGQILWKYILSRLLYLMCLLHMYHYRIFEQKPI